MKIERGGGGRTEFLGGGAQVISRKAILKDMYVLVVWARKEFDECVCRIW